MKNNKVVVTGGSGFVGRHLVKALLAVGFEVFVFTRGTVEVFTNIGLTTVMVDYSDIKMLAVTLVEINPNYIIHLSASRDRRDLNNNCINDINNSINSDINLITAATYLKQLSLFVYFGTADMYSCESGGKISLDSKVEPKNIYGLKKSVGKNLVESLFKTHGFPGVCLVPSVIYGPGQAPDMFLPALIDSLIKNQRFAMSDGNQMRDYIYVKDVVDVILERINKPNSVCFGRTILLGSGEAVSIKELALMVEPLIDVNRDSLLAIGTVEQRAGEPNGYSYDMNESFDLLDWKPKFSLHDGLIETVDYAKNVTHA